MARPSDLAALRLALLQQPGDPRCWQVLIERIEAMGAGLLLSELDGLFEQPLPASPAGRDSRPSRRVRFSPRAESGAGEPRPREKSCGTHRSTTRCSSRDF